MSDQDPRDTNASRLSARVVEEGYIRLQETMRTYRIARDQGNAAAGLDRDEDPVIVLQNEVQTFFSLVRPYIKDEPQLAEYWWGALATYPKTRHETVAEAVEYYREHSVGVWQTQKHTVQVPAHQPNLAAEGGQQALADGGDNPASLEAWHNALGLPKTVRVLTVDQAFDDEEFDGWYYVEGRFAVLGLREIANWKIRTRTERVQGDGFMGGETAVRERREPEPAKKVEAAANMLFEVADELSAIASFTPAGDRVHGTPVPDS
ncbi:MAG: hypothetical protein ACOCQY_05215 [Halorhabdus sp.]